jgi:hypothetical protein
VLKVYKTLQGQYSVVKDLGSALVNSIKKQFKRNVGKQSALTVTFTTDSYKKYQCTSNLKFKTGTNIKTLEGIECFKFALASGRDLYAEILARSLVVVEGFDHTDLVAANEAKLAEEESVASSLRDKIHAAKKVVHQPKQRVEESPVGGVDEELDVTVVNSSNPQEISSPDTSNVSSHSVPMMQENGDPATLSSSNICDGTAGDKEDDIDFGSSDVEEVDERTEPQASPAPPQLSSWRRKSGAVGIDDEAEDDDEGSQMMDDEDDEDERSITSEDLRFQQSNYVGGTNESEKLNYGSYDANTSSQGYENLDDDIIRALRGKRQPDEVQAETGGSNCSKTHQHGDKASRKRLKSNSSTAQDGDEEINFLSLPLAFQAPPKRTSQLDNCLLGLEDDDDGGLRLSTDGNKNTLKRSRSKNNKKDGKDKRRQKEARSGLPRVGGDDDQSADQQIVEVGSQVDKERKKRESVPMSDELLLGYSHADLVGFGLRATLSEFADDQNCCSGEELGDDIFDDSQLNQKSLDSKFLQYCRETLIADVFKDVYFMSNVIRYYRLRRTLSKTTDEDYLNNDWLKSLRLVGDLLVKDMTDQMNSILEQMTEKLTEQKAEKKRLRDKELTMPLEEREEKDLADLDVYTKLIAENIASMEAILKVMKRRALQLSHSMGLKICIMWARLNQRRALLSTEILKFERKFLMEPSMKFMSILSSDMYASCENGSPNSLDAENDDVLMLENADRGSLSIMAFGGQRLDSRFERVDTSLTAHSSSEEEGEGEGGREKVVADVTSGDLMDTVALATPASLATPAATAGSRSVRSVQFSVGGDSFSSPVGNTSASQSVLGAAGTGGTTAVNQLMLLLKGMNRVGDDTQMEEMIQMFNAKPEQSAIPVSDEEIEKRRKAALVRKTAKDAKEKLEKDVITGAATKLFEDMCAARGIVLPPPADNIITETAVVVPAIIIVGESAVVVSPQAAPLVVNKPPDVQQQVQTPLATITLGAGGLFRRFFKLLVNPLMEVRDKHINLQIFGERLSRKLSDKALLGMISLFLSCDATASESFLGSDFLASQFTCLLGVAYQASDYSNTVADGYCVSRAWFSLLERQMHGYSMTVADMKGFDQSVFIERREQFYNFLVSVHKNINDECNDEEAKISDKRKMKAMLTLFLQYPKLKCCPVSYWSCLDWASFSSYNVTTFSTNYLSAVPGYAQFHCASEFRKGEPHADIGLKSTTFKDVQELFKRPPNFCVLERSHAFVVFSPTQQDINESLNECTNRLFSGIFSNVMDIGEFLKQLKEPYNVEVSFLLAIVDKIIANSKYELSEKEADVLRFILNHFEVPQLTLKEIRNKGPGAVDFRAGDRGEVIDLCEDDDRELGDIDGIKMKTNSTNTLMNDLERQFASMQVKVCLFACLIFIYYPLFLLSIQVENVERENKYLMRLCIKDAKLFNEDLSIA